ncbi:MAG: hypothetical protein HY360_22920 [Verrucomicrobia bacterium]|nr:hypothetical protein [Verrucomicrobiota bacterium]
MKKNKKWMLLLKDQRDNIIHYKSKVILFETKPDISFAILNTAGTEKTVKTIDGGSRLVTIPVFGYINSQMLYLHTFLQVDLVNAIDGHIKRQGMSVQHVGSDPRMTCMGITLFKEKNNITYPEHIL